MRKRLLFARWRRKINKTIFHIRPIFFSDEKMFTIEGGKILKMLFFRIVEKLQIIKLFLTNKTDDFNYSACLSIKV